MKHIESPRTRKVLCITGLVVLLAMLITSVALNVYQYYWGFDSYLQNTDEIYIMEAGILRNNRNFAQGEELELVYDFDNESYAELRQRYDIESIAGNGTEFERAVNLMDEFSSRLTHESWYDNHVPMNALALLDYSLDDSSHGINCRSKAQILNEMCLSLGIYARKVWIMPYSAYDNDCHVVNEVWDDVLGKWVMLDITNNEYWIDKDGTPLSVIEIRRKGAMNEFCTPVHPDESDIAPAKLKQKNIGDFLYIMKNMVYMEYCTEYTVGESESRCYLAPDLISIDNEPRIAQAACECSPK